MIDIRITMLFCRGGGSDDQILNWLSQSKPDSKFSNIKHLMLTKPPILVHQPALTIPVGWYIRIPIHNVRLPFRIPVGKRTVRLRRWRNLRDLQSIMDDYA